MREVLISSSVSNKIDDLKDYLIFELKLSEEAAMRRIDRISDFLTSLHVSVDYPLCRFRKWRLLGYRCAVFEKRWVFAYELFEDGIIVKDMFHVSLLVE
ncbi:MAG TPA: hypothetical protein DDZ96_11820 [Porphyromonadaceae bacterium]|jgi:hypothetical protein|nr:hypothetical protein [Porphyromonadaceae bacterium]HBK31565.1 hypothetical protein [Porphyromonadaceae bacterium]HBL34486.1 hypothetical protein [Porphyromonadaceae bacterium]HBX21162.1 hypothetical protein [Porphyromonadaceae bacterium]HBX46097.1 hypothetical protein [Porphyromonadaceae bacterium]